MVKMPLFLFSFLRFGISLSRWSGWATFCGIHFCSPSLTSAFKWLYENSSKRRYVLSKKGRKILRKAKKMWVLVSAYQNFCELISSFQNMLRTSKRSSKLSNWALDTAHSLMGLALYWKQNTIKNDYISEYL